MSFVAEPLGQLGAQRIGLAESGPASHHGSSKAQIMFNEMASASFGRAAAAAGQPRQWKLVDSSTAATCSARTLGRSSGRSLGMRGFRSAGQLAAKIWLPSGEQVARAQSKRKPPRAA